MPAQCRNPLRIAVVALEGAVHDRPLLHGAIPILPPVRHMPHEIEGEEALAGLRPAPQQDNAARRDQFIHQARDLSHARSQLPRLLELEAATSLARFLALCFAPGRLLALALACRPLGLRPCTRQRLEADLDPCAP